MLRCLRVPPGALDDIRELILLDRDQLQNLDRLFSMARSASPLKNEFVSEVAESLHISVARAQSIVVVCHLLLLAPEDTEQVSEDRARDVIDDLKDFIGEHEVEADRPKLLEALEAHFDLLMSLATPKSERQQSLKIRRLSQGPEARIESLRTICQLRPLFQGPMESEEITGLVPNIVLEIESTESDGMVRTTSFGLTTEMLEELSKVVERTKRKLDTIQQKYPQDILRWTNP